MDYAKCAEYSAYGACYFGNCGGPNMDTSYCANENKYQAALAAQNASNAAGRAYSAVLNDLNSVEAEQNLCDYCAAQSTAHISEDERCMFNNKGITARIDGNFSCSCNADYQKVLENYKFAPERGFCSNGLYCCSIG
jgi:hypothetical protein